MNARDLLGKAGRGENKHGYYMLVRKGFVQRFGGCYFPSTGRVMKSWPVAQTHGDAERLRQYFIQHHGASSDIRPALIGSIDGETLEGHVRLAIEDGCEAVVCVDGWNADGSPRFKSIMFD